MKVNSRKAKEALNRHIQSLSDRKRAEEVLNKHFHNISIQSIAESRQSGTKTVGETAGHIRADVTEYAKGKSMMYKPSNKAFSEAEKDRRDWTMEYLLGGLYKRMLYSRAPTIELVLNEADFNPDAGSKKVVNSNIKNVIGYRSLYLDNFQTLNEGIASKTLPLDIDGTIKIRNFEKVMAACMMGGEVDYHTGNIGFVIENTNGTKEYIAAKIDHGRSGFRFYQSESDLREKLADGLKWDQYKEKGFKFNLHEFHQAVKEINKITDDEIDKLISSRLYKLQQLNYDISQIDYDANFEHSQYPSPKQLADYKAKMKGAKDPKKQYDVAREFFVGKFKAQLKVMKSLEATLEIITKINFNNKNEEEKFLNGGWIEEMRGKDPIQWAVKNSQKIDGLDPKKWEIKNFKRKRVALGIQRGRDDTEEIFEAAQHPISRSTDDDIVDVLHEKVVSFSKALHQTLHETIETPRKTLLGIIAWGKHSDEKSALLKNVEQYVSEMLLQDSVANPTLIDMVECQTVAKVVQNVAQGALQDPAYQRKTPVQIGEQFSQDKKMQLQIRNAVYSSMSREAPHCKKGRRIER